MQLMGDEITEKQADKDCEPIVRNQDIGKPLLAYDGTTTLDPLAVAIPCGLIAKSVFTDRYQISTASNFAQGSDVTIDSSDIAWRSDTEFKFKNQEGNWQEKQWLDITDQHFIVWMRTAGLPNFRKLYGKIQDGLEGDTTYYVRITNTYDVSGFDGSKTFVLSTTNALGGQNYFLAIAYMVVGALCLVLAMIFLGVCLSKGRDSKKSSQTAAPAQN